MDDCTNDERAADGKGLWLIRLIHSQPGFELSRCYQQDTECMSRVMLVKAEMRTLLSPLVDSVVS